MTANMSTCYIPGSVLTLYMKSLILLILEGKEKRCYLHFKEEETKT